MNYIIEVDTLTRRFGNITAVDRISFVVEEGTIFGFLGPNGAGKTTTINILCTLLRPTSGRAFINGYDCIKEPHHVRKSIGIIFQDLTLDKDLTAYENLLFHCYLYDLEKRFMKERIEEVLKFFNLYDRKDEPVKRFSGGMKRRLEVARGLIHRPKVLFLDEPTLGLDPQSRANLWEHITKLPLEYGVTVFMTTHYMDEAEVCDRLAIIDNGKIIAEGTPEELKRITGRDIIYLKTRDNKRAMEIINQKLSLKTEIVNGEIYIGDVRGDVCIPELIRLLGDDVRSVRLQRPTLNDVFLKLTGKEIRHYNSSEEDDVRAHIRAYRRRYGRG